MAKRQNSGCGIVVLAVILGVGWAVYDNVTTPNDIALPNLVGMTEDDADDVLDEAVPEKWTGVGTLGVPWDISPLGRIEPRGWGDSDQTWVVYGQSPAAGTKVTEPEDDVEVDYFVLTATEWKWYAEHPTMPAVTAGPYDDGIAAFASVDELTLEYWEAGRQGSVTETWDEVFDDGQPSTWTDERPVGETESEREMRRELPGVAGMNDDYEETVLTGRSMPKAGEPLRPGQLIMLEVAVIPEPEEPHHESTGSSDGSGGGVSGGAGVGVGRDVDVDRPNFCSRKWWC